MSADASTHVVELPAPISEPMQLADFRPMSLEEQRIEHWPNEIEHVSATQLTMFMRCPDQYRRRYLLGEKERPSGAQVIGRVEHSAIEACYRWKLERTTGDIPIPELEDVASHLWDDTVKELGGFNDIDWKDATNRTARRKAHGTSKDQTIRIARLYREYRVPHVRPRRVEHRFSIPLPGLPIPLVGVIDVVRQPATLLEVKTTSKREFRPDWRFQGELYQLAHTSPIEWDLAVKTKEPRILPAQYRLNRPDQQRKDATIGLVRGLVGQIGALYDTYGPDDPWPTTALAHPWACGYCGWGPQGNRTCQWWQGKTVKEAK